MTVPQDLVQNVSRALGHMGIDISAAEFHGNLTGQLCARGTMPAATWLEGVLPEREEGDLLVGEARVAFTALYEDTVLQLNSTELSFAPLLPPDDASTLQERVVALGEWCAGFLMGLAEGGIKQTEKLPGDAAEVMRDFINISNAASYQFGESDEDENAYTELVEYVRTGVLLMNEDVHPVKAPPRNDQLH